MPHRLSQLPMTCALPTVKPTRASRPNRTSRVLTDQQASALQLEYQRGGISTTALGLKYGVSQQVAHRIATGRLYSDLPTAPKRDRTPWVDPRVRYRGCPSDAELRALKGMLRDHPNRWALVKKVKALPVDCDASKAFGSWGLVVEARQELDGWWGVYVSFPAGVPLDTMQFATVRDMAVA